MNITGLRDKLGLTGTPTQDVGLSAQYLLAMARAGVKPAPGRSGALNIYAGTVPAAEVTRRRARNKQARVSRRANRGRR